MIHRIAPKHETSRHLRERAREGIKANLVTMLCGWRESSFHNQFPTRRDEKGMKLVRLIKHENYIAQWVGQKSGMLSHCQVTTAVRCRRGKAKLKISFKSSLELFPDPIKHEHFVEACTRHDVIYDHPLSRRFAFSRLNFQ